MDSSPCSDRDQTTIPTRNKCIANDEYICKYPNRLNHNCNDQCYSYIDDCNQNNDMGLSGNRRSNYFQKFRPYSTQVCVLVLVACISFTQSAPSTIHHQVRHRREDQLTQWTRPCMLQNMSQNETNYTTEQMQGIFNIIASECITALHNAQSHAPQFISFRWKTNLTDTIVNDTHQRWQHENGASLHPERNKQFSYSEDIPSEIKNKIVRQLKNLNKEDSEHLLIDMYKRFMRIAEGIELIIEDHKGNNVYNDVANYELTHIYDKLKQDIDVILCEINEGILLLKLTPEEPERLQVDSINDKGIIVRDWVIYREYMSLLNFISKVYYNHE